MDLNTSPEDSQPTQHKYQKLKQLTTQVFVHNDQKFDTSKYVALVRKKQVQKPLLSTLDIIICLTVLSPCVVGVWRGIWTIMDIYEPYFPAWHSLILGLAIHFVFVLIQDMLNDIIKGKSSSLWIKIFHVIMSRIYVYIFVVACNMHWRGSWIIFDKYIGIVYTDKGAILKYGLKPILIVTFGCLLLIISMRCVCNSLSAPFLFFLDRKNNMYTIPTRFKSKIVYAILHLVNDGSNFEKLEPPPNETPEATAEKLVSAESRKREIFVDLPPKPFGVSFRGVPPAQFMGSTTTEKMTTLNYPQMRNHRHKHFPKNIQDVIGYNRYRRPSETKNYKQYTPPNRANFSENDPFYSYKPQDPGDINLLATASVRFAPPIWKSTSKSYPQQQQPYHQENTNQEEIYNSINQKPLSVTLNIYPNDEIRGDNRQGLKHFISHRLGSRVRFPEDKAKKMVIHLNLYPDMLGGENKKYRNVVKAPIHT